MMLLSLAGIPATMGFLAKFYVLTGAASTMNWSLIIILAMTSTIGLFYYLRILVALYSGSSDRATIAEPRVSSGDVVLALLTALLFSFGIYPAPLVDVIQAHAVPSVVEFVTRN
jgi:NADH-quinone oxidoreductase subunit N